MDVAAFTCVCQEDLCWVDQYLAEMERLKMSFCMHFDRCSPKQFEHAARHPLCIATSRQNNKAIEFNEKHKQGVLDRLFPSKARWAISLDIDETLEEDAPAKLEALNNLTHAQYISIRWVNLWMDREHVRLDGPFAHGRRSKVYNLRVEGYRWYFDHVITNGAKLVRADQFPVRRSTQLHYYSKPITERVDLACLHWGLMTPELCIQHRERWNRIYGRAAGKNPYGTWDDAVLNTPIVVPYSEVIRNGEDLAK